MIQSALEGTAPIDVMDGGTNDLDEAIARWNLEAARRNSEQSRIQEPLGGFG